MRVMRRGWLLALTLVAASTLSVAAQQRPELKPALIIAGRKEHPR